MATFTIRHLHALAESHGYKGPPTDWEAMKKHLADLKDDDNSPNPVTKCRWGTEEIDIPSLVFQKTEKPRGRVATLMMDDDLEGAEDKIKAMVEKRVADELARNGKPRSNGRITQVSESERVTNVKSGEERTYEHRIKSGNSVFKSYEMAYGFGRDIQYKALRAMGRHDEAEVLYKNTAEQLTQKGYTLTTTAAGAALAPEGFDADLHQLLLQYGIARRVCRTVRMNEQIVTRPKATGDLTVYYPADGAAGTESTKTWSNVQLQAKQGVVIVKTSRALVQDSPINVADDAGRDIVRAIARVEDRTLFLSNGTGVANNYIPGCQGILNIIDETATSARMYESLQTNALAITLADVIATMALPGAYVGLNPSFHCTPQIAAAVLLRLAAAAGGVTMRELQGFGLVPTFLGVPIIYNNVMTTNTGTSGQLPLLVYGDISLAADFGDRMGVTVEISEQRYWDENNIGVKGTVRHDINVHGIGITSVGTTPTTGPLSVLHTATS